MSRKEPVLRNYSGLLTSVTNRRDDTKVLASQMVKLTPKEFILQLEQMYRKGPSGSVFVTFKHFTGVYSVKKSGKDLKRMPKTETGVDPGSPMLLIRASDGNKKKISSIVTPKDIVAFQIALDKLMKTNLVGFQKSH